MPKEPLTDEEERILIDAAKEMGEFRYTPGSAPVGVERSVLFMLDTGCHPSVLSNPDSELRVEGKGSATSIVWKRPKKKGHDAVTRIPASKRIAPWAAEFIATPRPRFRQFYNAMLRELAERIEKERGNYRGLSKKNLSPIALRHTFGVRFLNLTKDPYLTQQAMNCSWETLRFYMKYRDDMIMDKLHELGW